MGTREIVLSTVVPTLVALVMLVATHTLLSRRVRKPDGQAPDSQPGDSAGETTGTPDASGSVGAGSLGWLTLLLLAGSVVLGSYAWQSRVDLWSASATHRFPAIAGVALVAGLVCVLVGPIARRPLLQAVPAALGGAAVAWFSLGVLHPSFIGQTERWAWVGGVGVIAGVQAFAIAAGASRLTGWRAPVLLWLVLGLIALGATAGLANAPLVLFPAAGVMFALGVAGLFRPRVDLLRGVGPFLAVLVCGATTFADWFGDVERHAMFGLLVAAPVGLGVAALPGIRRARPVVRLLAAGVVSLGLSGAQAGMSVPSLIEAQSGGGDWYDYAD